MDICPKCGGVRTPAAPVTFADRIRAAAAAATIPPTPSLHDRVRAAAAAAGRIPTVNPPVERVAAGAIPPAPSLHDRVRHAARRSAA